MELKVPPKVPGRSSSFQPQNKSTGIMTFRRNPDRTNEAPANMFVNSWVNSL
jgi:hypothetical protein